MFLNHDRAFAEILTTEELAAPLTTSVQLTCLYASTLVETETGWRSADTLNRGDRLYTLDGGLVPLSAVRHHPAEGSDHTVWQVPAGVLDTCSELSLYNGQHVAVSHDACQTLFGADVVLAPIGALAGYRGIMPRAAKAQAFTEISFASEEIIYAQTGALLHVANPTAEAFFQRLDYGQTRALLAMIERGQVGPDPKRFAA